MSNAEQGELFMFPKRYEVNKATEHPPEIVQLGDKLHDA